VSLSSEKKKTADEVFQAKEAARITACEDDCCLLAAGKQVFDEREIITCRWDKRHSRQETFDPGQKGGDIAYILGVVDDITE